MEIQYLPSSPKYPQTEHVRNDIGETLIHAGFAVRVSEPPRGSAEWLAWRNKRAQTVTAPSPYDTIAGAPGTTWGVLNQRNGVVLVIKRVDSDTFFFDAPPAECPRSVIQQFLDACAANTGANAVAIAEAKKVQAEQDRKDKSAGRITVLSAMFGSKPL